MGILVDRSNSMELTEEAEEHLNEVVSKQQEQLNWVKIQLAVAEEERDHLRDERQYIDDQLKSRKIPS